MKIRSKTECKCRFCNDADFAFRHTMEDDALLRIAELATDIAAQGILDKELLKKLKEALQFFNDLDDHVAQEKRAIAALRRIEDDLT